VRWLADVRSWGVQRENACSKGIKVGQLRLDHDHVCAVKRGGLMTLLMSLPVEAGSEETLVVEVDRNEIPEDLVLASEPGKVIVRAQVTLEQALARLKPSLEKVVGLLKELSPDHTVVEFGLKLGGETGAIIAKGTAEVNFKVTVSWGHE
jgi:hypothetical protein